MTTKKESLHIDPKVQDLIKCKANFLYFLWPKRFGEDKQFVFIADATTMQKVAFEDWDHLVALATDLQSGASIINLKSRQIGWTWLLSAFCIWRAQFFNNVMIPIFSQGENEAKDVIIKCKYIRENLPNHLTLELKSDASQSIVFRTTGSEIRAMPSTERAGHGITATVLIYDEHEFHPYAEANFSAAKPTVDAGGQMIVGSTVDKTKAVTLFKALFKEAVKGANGLKPHFYNVWVRPGRDEAWYQKTMREIPQEMLLTRSLTREQYMEENYPRTIEEALSPSQALAAFDFKALTAMKQDAREPVERSGNINIWQKYSVGKTYVAFTDTSHGVGQDDAVTVVLDAVTGYVVADIQSNVISPEELAYQSVELLKMYKEPLWGIEDNDWGAIVILRAQDMGYKKLFMREWQKAGKVVPEGKTPGWHTDRSRIVLFGELIAGIRDRLITIPSEKGLGQFFECIRNPEKNGRIEAIQGSHDDYPMAVGGAWQMRKYAPFGNEGPRILPSVFKRKRKEPSIFDMIRGK